MSKNLVNNVSKEQRREEYKGYCTQLLYLYFTINRDKKMEYKFLLIKI